ncbi:MAG: cation transporter [Acidobacteria bacterium 13_1_20CM_2_57_8]|nr:MAG: cation transporter [Acidobacteria bacterium 13_1_20CM_2_57_8]
MRRIIALALEYRFFIFFVTALVVIAGIAALQQLPIDAVPDITPNQVLVLGKAPGLSPLEVEQFLTFPVEFSMSGLPGITQVQSVSKNGLSYVAIYFREDVDAYFARRLVSERLPQVRELIPAGVSTPEMGPISTGLGEIYQFKVTGAGYSPMDLRSILDWDIAPKLRRVPGIVEVNSHGGELKTYEIQVDSDKLMAYRIPLATIIKALEENNGNVGGAYLEHAEQQSLIRGEALISNLSDIEQIVLGVSPSGTPITVKNVAQVRFAPMVRQGFATQDGKGEIVLGIAMMLVGENSRTVVDDVKTRLADIQKSLPKGIRIEPFYDRTDLVRRTIETVRKNLVEGGLLVVAVLLFLLGSLRGGLIVSLAIPLSMLAAFVGMVRTGISGNLMSLGALDFGLIVDGSVVMVENILRRLRERKPDESSRNVVRSASEEVARPVFFGVAIIVLVYVPILTLSGVEGKMFKPMATTVLFALLASLVIALILMPVLSWIAFRNIRRQEAEKETWVMRQFHRWYEPALNRTLRFPKLTVGIAIVVFAVSLSAVPFLGREFIPRFDEGSIVIMMYRLPGISLAESQHGNEIIESVIKHFPEVDTVVSRTGRPEVATDPMALDQSDVYVMLKPLSEWPAKKTKEELIGAMKSRLEEEAPGAAYSFSQPIQMRMQELMEAGVRSDVAAKLYGDDLNILREKAEQAAAVIQRIPGAADVRTERVAGLPYLRIHIRRDSIARHGLSASDVLNTVESVGGKVVGQVIDGHRRFAMQIRFQESQRSSIDAIRNLKVGDPEGHFIPLSQLADIIEEEGPAQISRENGQRRVSVEMNVRGRDLGSFVADARTAVENQVKLPEGYFFDWGGQFKQLESASRRLMIAVPLALLTIFALLYLNFGTVVPALLIFLNVPLAATGGILALLARGMPFSISAGVGFIALFGVAVLNGVVLLTYISQLRERGRPLNQAVSEGARTRLRPVLMTALVASLGFVPMAVSTGSGAEVQRPLATVVIGGLITSTALTLLVLPVFYAWISGNQRGA